MRKTHTKSALLTSAIALLLCFVMLLGTTFAWFTDEVTSAGNIIQSGTLDITMEWADGKEDPANATWKDASAGAIFNYDNWEPGYTEVRHIRIANKGSLALKYALSIIPTGEASDLTDVIDVYYADPAVQVADRDALTGVAPLATLTQALANLGTTGNGTLIAGEEIVITIALKMQEAAGNEYQAKSIGSDFAVRLLATQLTYEEDSFDDQYDKDSVMGVVANDYAALKSAIANAVDGDTIVLGADIEDADGVLITDKDITIDLAGKTFTITEGASTNNRIFKVTGDSNVTIKNGTLIAEGDITSGAYGTVRAESGANVTLDNVKLYSYRGYGLNVKANTGSKITINNSEIYAQYSGGVEAAGGEIELNNVTIKQEGVYSGAAWCSVAIGVNGGGKVVVNSGDYSAETISTDSNAAQGTWVAYVMSSGGDLVINGGTFNGVIAETASAANACGIICADRAAVVEINGGTFNSNGAILDMRNNVGTQPNPVATLNGGTFSADPTVSGLYSSNLIKIGADFKKVENADGTWSVTYDGATAGTAAELTAALASGEENILLTADISYDAGIVLADGVSLDGNGKTITYGSDEYAYHLVKMNTGASIKNVTFENYRVRTEDAANGDITLENVVINMDNDQTGLDISRGAGVAKLTNVTCKGTTDAAHLNPETQVQVDYTPYGDVLLGTKWGLEAVDCDFGSLQGWNTTNNSSVSLTNTTTTVFRMHYWPNRTLYINGVETAWSESGAIPVAHDVGGCWSVQPAFK